MNLDLHCHSNASDGILNPNEVMKLAIERQVDLLSITDHDTPNAYHNLTESPHIRFLRGIELSTSWRNLHIHIVGLNLDISHQSILTAVQLHTGARAERAEKIATKL